MLLYVAVARTDVSEVLISSIVMVTRFVELGTTLAVTGNRSRLRRSANSGDGGDTILRNVGFYKSHIVQHPRKKHSS
jgi:hypothetical protein